jgi:hypothetical protein
MDGEERGWSGVKCNGGYGVIYGGVLRAGPLGFGSWSQEHYNSLSLPHSLVSQQIVSDH